MKKLLWIAIIWLALLALVTPRLWAATYNIGPGQTYETFTALVAAQTLDDNDIVDGGGNTFTEAWLPDGSGTAGHVITLRNATITCPADAQRGMLISGRSYITVSNITFNGGLATYRLLYIANSNNIIVSGCTFASTTPAELVRVYSNSANTNSITFTGCTFNNSAGVEAIRFFLDSVDYNIYDVSVTGCTFNDVKYGVRIYGGALDVGETKNHPILDAGIRPYGFDINGNTFTTLGYCAFATNCGLASTNQSYIRNNTMTNIGTAAADNVNAVQLNSCIGVIVENNTITTVTTDSPDGHGIIIDYAFASTDHICDGVIVRNNIISGCKWHEAVEYEYAAGICNLYGTDSQIYNNYIFDCGTGIVTGRPESTGATVYNNTIWDCFYAGYDNKGGSPAVTLTNNIFSSCGTGIYVRESSTVPTDSYNDIYNSTTHAYYNATTEADITPGTGSITGNPLLSSYSIASDSPCRSAGLDLSATFTTDLTGWVRTGNWDIGAWEFRGSTAGGSFGSQ